MRQRSPTVCHWVRQLDDLSGNTGEWSAPDSAVVPAVQQLLELCGEAYLPFLAANEEAVHDDQDRVTLPIFGRQFSQPVFRYQVKCYSRLKALFAALPDATLEQLTPLLDETNCLQYLR